ncbi:hypothetical protein FQR65_LT12235 [Abscondita terminalis]|nr:hypothetical protein FQR65_LT12235 [Abscondita terminalis]
MFQSRPKAHPLTYFTTTTVIVSETRTMNSYVSISVVIFAFPPETNSNFRECVEKTIENVFTNDESIIYVYDDKLTFLVTEENPRILYNTRVPIHVPQTYKNYHHNYVIHADEYLELFNALIAVNDSDLYHGKLFFDGKFLLITNDQELEKKILMFWSVGVINLIVLAYNSLGGIQMHTGNPQAVGNNCGENVKELLSVNDCLRKTHVLLPHVFRKYTNCNITYMNYVAPTPDKIKVYELILFVFDMLAERFDVSLIMRTEPIVAPYYAGLFTVYTVNPAHTLPDRVVTSTIYTDKMVWVVPFPKRIPTMKILQMVFTNTLWVYIVVVFVGTSFVWWFITKTFKRSSSMTQAFLKVFSITLFGWVDNYGRWRPIRCLFLTYVVYSIHIQTAFTSKLIEILTIPQYEHAIKSLSELSASDVEIIIYEKHYESYFNHTDDDALYNKIKSKLVVLNYSNYDDVAGSNETYTKYAALFTNNEVEIVSNMIGEELITIADSILVSNWEMAFGGVEGTYIIKTIDKLIDTLTESGLLNYVKNNIKYEIETKRFKKDEEKPVLSLQHLYFVFVFWGVGLALSFLILFFELLSSNNTVSPHRNLHIWTFSAKMIIVHLTILLIILKTDAFFTNDDPIFMKCFARTIAKVFTKNETITHIYNKNVDFPIAKNNPIVVFNSNFQIHTSSTYKNSHNYVLHADTYKDVLIVLQALALSKLWHNNLTRDGKFVLITNEKNMAQKITFFWSFGAINLVILVTNFKDIASVFTSDPQASNNNCGLNFKDVLSIAGCFAQTPIILPKIMRKYVNCNVTHIFPISEPSNKIRQLESIRFLLDLIVERLNVSLKTISTVTSSQPFDFFSILTTYRRLPKHEFTSTFFVDKVVWVVPFPRQIPIMKVLQIVFKEIVWIYVFVAFVGTSIVWWAITKLLSRTSSISLAFLDMFSVTLFGSVNSVNLFWSRRFLLLAYVLYSIHIQTAFTSKLIEVLTIPQYEPRIKTLDELCNSNVTIYARQDIYNHFFEHEEPDDTLFTKIKNKLKVLPTELFTAILMDHNTYKNSAILLTSNEAEMLNKHLQKDFCIIDDCTLVSNVYQVFEGGGGAYILKTIDHIISLLNESGILNYFLKNVEYKVFSVPVIKEKKKPPLSLQHLYFVFVFWGAGLLLSACTLAIELTYNYGMGRNFET